MAKIRFLDRIRQSGYLVPAALTGYLWLKGGWPDLPGLSCPLRALTGIPCPTCFLTRATCASLRGDWHQALELHAFGPLASGACRRSAADGSTPGAWGTGNWWWWC